MSRYKLMSKTDVLVAFLLCVPGLVIAYQNYYFDKQLKAKDNEIFQLRSKINNYLISSGAYSEKTVDILPVLKSFGIVKSFND